jgi:hypothetical protein
MRQEEGQEGLVKMKGVIVSHRKKSKLSNMKEGKSYLVQDQVLNKPHVTLPCYR